MRTAGALLTQTDCGKQRNESMTCGDETAPTCYFGSDEIATSLEDLGEVDVSVADLDAVFVVVFIGRFTDESERQSGRNQ